MTYLIIRYADKPAIEPVTPNEDENYVTRSNGLRALRLGDVFPTFDEAKAELERRAWRRLREADEELDNAEEYVDQVSLLEIGDSK